MTPRQRFMLIIPGVLFLVAFGAFELGRLAGRKEAERKLSARKPARSPEETKTSNEQLFETIFDPELTDKEFEFGKIVEGATGRKLLPFDARAEPHQVILQAIREAAAAALSEHNSELSPIRSLRRINEGSRYFEDSLRAHLDRHPDLLCDIPVAENDKKYRAGYPDLRIEHPDSNTVVYLDPKLFEEKSRSSSFRSFYFSASAGKKVRDDGAHLLLGFSHDGNVGAWKFTSWELIDLAKLTVGFKAEISASNRDFYRDELILARSQPSSD